MTDSNVETASLTVRLGAVAENYRTLGKLAGSADAAAVVKADGYGLGAGMVAQALAGAGCDTFFVARLSEGVALRPAVPKARILVLDGPTPETASALIAHNLTPVLNGLHGIAAWSEAAKSSRRTLDAVLNMDTGMNRLGLSSADVSTIAGDWKTRLAGLNLTLLMSHLACADDLGPGAAMNREQLSRFRAALAMLPPAKASLAASSGIFLGPDYHFDLVRPGIALWGVSPKGVSPKGQKNIMKTVAVLTAQVLQTRRIDKGQTVGYAATFRAKRPTMLATLALGYADGIMRAASNRGMAAFGKARAPYAGRVSMDLMTIDITGMATPPGKGDVVELFGDTVSVSEMAEYCATNEYEVLTGISPRVPRRYVDHA